eukprot:1879842-Amphidinium_carterae.1
MNRQLIKRPLGKHVARCALFVRRLFVPRRSGSTCLVSLGTFLIIARHFLKLSRGPRHLVDLGMRRLLLRTELHSAAYKGDKE